MPRRRAPAPDTVERLSPDRPGTMAFVVPGRPQPCQRARVSAVRRGKKLIFVGRTSPQTASYEQRVRMYAEEMVKALGWQFHRRDTFSLYITVYRADATHWGGFNRGDWDNFGKAISDGCNGVLWHDDAGVTMASVTLDCAPHNPHVRVVVTRLTDGREWRPPKRTRRRARTQCRTVEDDAQNGDD